MQESFWWWQCSDTIVSSSVGMIVSLLPPPPYPLPPFSPSIINLTVSVDVKHHVYLLTVGISNVVDGALFRNELHVWGDKYFQRKQRDVAPQTLQMSCCDVLHVWHNYTEAAAWRRMNWTFGSGQGLGYIILFGLPRVASNNQLTHAKIVQGFDPPASVCFGFLKFADTEGLSGGRDLRLTQQCGSDGQESMKTSSCSIIIYNFLNNHWISISQNVSLAE